MDPSRDDCYRLYELMLIGFRHPCEAMTSNLHRHICFWGGRQPTNMAVTPKFRILHRQREAQRHRRGWAWRAHHVPSLTGQARCRSQLVWICTPPLGHTLGNVVFCDQGLGAPILHLVFFIDIFSTRISILTQYLNSIQTVLNSIQTVFKQYSNSI